MGQGGGKDRDREINTVNHTVIHTANPMVRDIVNEKRYGLCPYDWTGRSIDCRKAGRYNATIKEASGLRLLSELNGVQVVVGSNPTTPTIELNASVILPPFW
jgi:hypothetical protein